MESQLQFSASMKPEGVLDVLRENTPDAGGVLESLERQPVFFAKQPVIVSRIDGHRFRLHFQGGRLEGRLSAEHVDGAVEATATGSRIAVELKNFWLLWRPHACIGLVFIVAGIALGMMLIDDLPVGGIIFFVTFPAYGVCSIVWPLRVAKSRKQKFLDFLSGLFDSQQNPETI